MWLQFSHEEKEKKPKVISNLQVIPILAIISQSGLLIVLANWLNNFKTGPLLLGFLCLQHLSQLFKTTQQVA